MSTVILKPNDKERQFQGIANLSAIEPPLWALVGANSVGDAILVDAEADGLNFEDTVFAVAKHNPEHTIILPTGNHPSAQMQQLDVSERLSKVIPNSEVKKSLWFDATQYNPRYGLVNPYKYRCHNWHSWTGISSDYGVVFTSVSCPAKCSFCNIRDWYGRDYAVRSNEDVFKDFEYYAIMGVGNIKVMDELFVTNTKRFMSICKDLVDMKFPFNIWGYARLDTIPYESLPLMKKAGINWLGIGIESGNYDIRRNSGKGKFDNNRIEECIRRIRGEGISVGANYIFGFPDDNKDTMRETLDLALKLRCEYSNFYSMMDYSAPKTPLEFAQYSYECNPSSTKYLTSREVLQMRDDAFSIYYSDPMYLEMMKVRFGDRVINEIHNMTAIKLRRKLYEDV